jgi:predicted esterase
MRHIFLLLFVVTVARAAPTSQPTTQPIPRDKLTQIGFTTPSPLSSPQAQNRRYRLQLNQDNKYTLANETFAIYVPNDDQPLGLFVWTSPSKRGTPPKDWLPMLAPHHLIWISADNAGNDRPIAARIGLALDAVYNVKKQLKIDETRVYVSGMSGGGKMASLIGVAYPDVFTGAIPICGPLYFRNIALAGDPKKAWPAGFARPPLDLFDRARKNNRYVLITGEKDMNRDPTKDTYEKGFKVDHFAHVEYVEVPGMGHTIPNVDVIEHAIQSLDAPLKK